MCSMNSRKRSSLSCSARSASRRARRSWTSFSAWRIAASSRVRSAFATQSSAPWCSASSSRASSLASATTITGTEGRRRRTSRSACRRGSAGSSYSATTRSGSSHCSGCSTSSAESACSVTTLAPKGSRSSGRKSAGVCSSWISSSRIGFIISPAVLQHVAIHRKTASCSELLVARRPLRPPRGRVVAEGRAQRLLRAADDPKGAALGTDGGRDGLADGAGGAEDGDGGHGTSFLFVSRCRNERRPRVIVKARQSASPPTQRKTDMEYMLLIYSDAAQFDKLSESQKAEGLAAYAAYSEALQKAGVMRGANRLRPSDSATTVRLKSGKTEVLNGPYAETREQLGGYFLIDAPDLDAALSC